MKSKFCRNKLFWVGMIVFLMLLIGACSKSQDTLFLPAPSWETLVSLSTYPAFSDFTPTGQSVLYTGHLGLMEEFTFPTTVNPQGVFNSLTPPSDNIDYYISFAWVGGYLYMVNGYTVYVYNIATDSWTTPVTSLTYWHYESQSTADDSGFVYSLSYNSGTPYLLKYHTTDHASVYIKAPLDVVISGGNETRAAWDSTTRRVYLSDYTNTIFYAFNPGDGTFTALASFPDSTGMSDAFCSDRRGHIFTANSSSSSTATDVWMYTAATDTWTSFTPLPFAHGNNAACTVSADGYLYFGDGNNNNFARIKVF